MSRLTILGCGAAPGVPAIAGGWGACDPSNPKNRRRRNGAYVEIGEAKILIDTSPEIRCQILDNNVCKIDGVLYTHAHADHLHGIDDLRDFNRLYHTSINVYGNAQTCDTIRQRFHYLVTNKDKPFISIYTPSICVNEVTPGEPFFVNGVEIIPLPLSGHSLQSTGYILNDGEMVYIADCKEISEQGLSLIKKRPEILVLPLTSIEPQPYHMGLDKLLEYVNIIKPRQTIINHMAIECDYDHVNALTPGNVCPAYDNMKIEF